MNYCGFVIDTGSDLLQSTERGRLETEALSDIELLMQRYGLTPQQLEANDGHIVAENLHSILCSIENENLALEHRIILSAALLSWHRCATDEIKANALKRAYFKFTEVIKFILIDPDGANLTITGQRVALNLALLLQRQVQTSIAFQEHIYRDILRALQYVVDKDIVLAERESIEEPASLRCESLKALMRCLPFEGALRLYLFYYPNNRSRFDA
jgi:hypothetical protein